MAIKQNYWVKICRPLWSFQSQRRGPFRILLKHYRIPYSSQITRYCVWETPVPQHVVIINEKDHNVKRSKFTLIFFVLVCRFSNPEFFTADFKSWKNHILRVCSVKMCELVLTQIGKSGIPPPWTLNSRRIMPWPARAVKILVWT